MTRSIEIASEAEFPGGWRFIVQVLNKNGSRSRHFLTLAWADYNLWSADGSDTPSNVAEAVLKFLSERSRTAEIPSRFDASVVRRQFADADQIIPTMISR